MVFTRQDIRLVTFFYTYTGEYIVCVVCFVTGNIGDVGGFTTFFSTLILVVVSIFTSVSTSTTACAPSIALCSGTCVLVGVSSSSCPIITRGGRSRGVCPTSLAGVIATVMAVRGIRSLRRRMAISGRTFGVLLNANTRITKLGMNRALAIRRLLCLAVIRSTYSTARILTRFINNAETTFIRGVGRCTGSLNYRGAGFIGPSNLRSRGRCAATSSVSGVTLTTLGGPRFAGVYGAIRCRCGNGGFCRAGLVLQGNCISCCCGCTGNIGANSARRTNCYIVAATDGSKCGCLTIILNTPIVSCGGSNCIRGYSFVSTTALFS